MLCTTNPLMLLEIRWSECSGVGAGAMMVLDLLCIVYVLLDTVYSYVLAMH